MTRSISLSSAVLTCSPIQSRERLRIQTDEREREKKERENPSSDKNGWPVEEWGWWSSLESLQEITDHPQTSTHTHTHTPTRTPSHSHTPCYARFVSAAVELCVCVCVDLGHSCKSLWTFSVPADVCFGCFTSLSTFVISQLASCERWKKKYIYFFWYRLCESKHTRKTFFLNYFFTFSQVTNTSFWKLLQIKIYDHLPQRSWGPYVCN